MIRIIAGKYRSRLLNTPPEEITRPTKNMVREAIFSSLSYDIKNSIVLDLFSGSGAFSFESLSRGAQCAYLVDNNNVAIKVIEENKKSLNEMNAFLFELDYKKALELFVQKNLKFDIVFLDPPYKDNNYLDIINLMLNNDILSKNAIIVCESDHLTDFVSLSFTKIKQYKYGKTFVYILRR